MAEHAYPTGRGTSYPGSEVQKSTNPNNGVAAGPLFVRSQNPVWVSRFKRCFPKPERFN